MAFIQFFTSVSAKFMMANRWEKGAGVLITQGGCGLLLATTLTSLTCVYIQITTSSVQVSGNLPMTEERTGKFDINTGVHSSNKHARKYAEFK